MKNKQFKWIICFTMLVIIITNILIIPINNRSLSLYEFFYLILTILMIFFVYRQLKGLVVSSKEDFLQNIKNNFFCKNQQQIFFLIENNLLEITNDDFIQFKSKKIKKNKKK